MFCKNCGNQLEYASTFCRRCGAQTAPAGRPFYPPAKKRSRTPLVVTLVAAVLLLSALAVWLFLGQSGGDSVFEGTEEVLIDMNPEAAP
jgi:hypothetical protein